MKLSLKTKLVTVGAAVVLGLGGAGVWHWHSKPAPTKTTVVHQQEMKSKKATSASTAPKVVIPKTAPKTAPQVQSANPPVRIEEKQEEISDEEWAQLEQLLAEEESSQEKKDETRDEEDAPEELTLAVRRVDELSTEIDKVDGEIEEIIRENEELKQREEYYDSIGNHVEQNNILRRIIELGNRVSQLQDPSVRAHRERAKLLAVVAKYALQEHPVAIDFLKKFEKRYGVSYKEFLLPEDKRLLLPEGGEK